MTLASNLQVAGIALILLAGLHLLFPKRFRWAEEFRDVSLLSRQMFYVHTWFIALVVFLNGLLFLFLNWELLKPTKLSAGILGGITLFWIVRFISQFFVYSPDLWRGKKFETAVHLLASLLWLYLSVSSFLAFLQVATHLNSTAVRV